MLRLSDAWRSFGVAFVDLYGNCACMEHGGQVFGQRGFVTRVILASSDVSKISSLDEEVTDLLRDFQVSLCQVVWLCGWLTAV